MDTKKTQALAEEKRQLEREREEFKSFTEQADPALKLWQAMDRDPIGTLQYLQQFYIEKGLTDPKDPDTLAMEDRIRQLEAEKQARERDEKDRETKGFIDKINSQLNSLEEKHGENFNREAVVKYMVENDIRDAVKAYKAMTHDDAVTSLQKQIAAMKADTEAKLKAARDEAINEYVKSKATKADTPPPVGAGRGNNAPPVQINPPKSFRDARKAALSRFSGASGGQ